LSNKIPVGVSYSRSYAMGKRGVSEALTSRGGRRINQGERVTLWDLLAGDFSWEGRRSISKH